MRVFQRRAAAVAALAVIAGVIAFARPVDKIASATSFTNNDLATSESSSWSRP